MDFRLAVIVVHYGEQDPFLRDCAESLRRNLPPWAYIVECDNTTPKRNLSALWNYLAGQVSSCEFVCFLNPDVMISADTFPLLVSAMDRPENSRIAVMGPSSNDGPTKFVPFISLPMPPRQEHVEMAARDARKHAEERGEIRDVNIFGHLYLIRRSILSKYSFDEDFPLYGGETDLNERLREDGFRVCQVRAAYAWHWGGYCGRDETKEELDADKVHAQWAIEQKCEERRVRALINDDSIRRHFRDGIAPH